MARSPVPLAAEAVERPDGDGDRHRRTGGVGLDRSSDPSITKYQYQQQVGSSGYSGWIDMTGSGAATTGYTVIGLTADTVHGFKVRAVNDVRHSPASAEATATRIAAIPGWSRSAR